MGSENISAYTLKDILRIVGGDIEPHERLFRFKFLLDQNLQLSEAIANGTIRDDALYFGIGLPWTGREVKSALERPEARTYLLTTLAIKRSEWKDELSCYPNRNAWQVWQQRENWWWYQVKPSFQPAHNLIEALGLPSSPEQHYSLFIFSGDTLSSHNKKYQNYAVEEFGLWIKPPKHDPETIFRVPDPVQPDDSLYRCPPRYRIVNWGETLVQIWRTRVFACPINSVETNVERPFCAPLSPAMYYEETWHPTRGKNESIIGLQHLDKSSGARDLGEFKRDVLRIFGRKLRRLAIYETAAQLKRDLDAAALRISKYRTGRISLENFATELGIDRKTLSTALRRLDVRLPQVNKSAD